ncbi:SMI1/KNR4 family protein [Kitasatospora sp. NPDC048722]|uniref:SMI1/KNR4 family protein n=1 Tax=Kitasatospora sp. NPDC048722 TaxID=3155639 RepID=UPI0033E9A284
MSGRPRSREWPVDWSSAEARLGTALPADYRELAEHFGPGTFADFLNVRLPGPPSGSDVPFPAFRCLVEKARRLAELAAEPGIADVYFPHRLHPAPGGLLQWADSERADQFYWLTEGTDPNRWPVIARNEDGDHQARFDGSTTEFIHRLLTDRRHPFSISELLDHPGFEPYEAHEPYDPFEDRRLP